MKNLRQNKGITLVSLIVTIIVMVILAAIALIFSVGEDGVINQAEVAGEKQKYVLTEERVYSQYVYTPAGEVDVEETIKNIKSANIEGITIEEESGTIKLDNGKEINIKENSDNNNDDTEQNAWKIRGLTNLVFDKVYSSNDEKVQAKFNSDGSLWQYIEVFGGEQTTTSSDIDSQINERFIEVANNVLSMLGVPDMSITLETKGNTMEFIMNGEKTILYLEGTEGEDTTTVITNAWIERGITNVTFDKVYSSDDGNWKLKVNSDGSMWQKFNGTVMENSLEDIEEMIENGQLSVSNNVASSSNGVVITMQGSEIILKLGPSADSIVLK